MVLWSTSDKRIRTGGLGQALAEIQAPVGYDEYGYALSNKHSKIFHCSRGYPVNLDERTKWLMSLSIPEDLGLLPEESEIKKEIEAKYPPLNFLTTYNVKQSILKTGTNSILCGWPRDSRRPFRKHLPCQIFSISFDFWRRSCQSFVLKNRNSVLGFQTEQKPLNMWEKWIKWKPNKQVRVCLFRIGKWLNQSFITWIWRQN